MIWIRRGLLLLAVLIVLVASALALTYYTALGVRLAASIAESQMDGQLEIGEIEGSPYGGLRIERLALRTEGMAVSVDGLLLEVDWGELVGRQAVVRDLQIARLQLSLPETSTDTTAEPMDWRQPIAPVELPTLPVALDIQSLGIGELLIKQGETVQQVRAISIKASATRDSEVTLERLELSSPNYGEISLQAGFDGQRLRIDTARWQDPNGQQLTLSGTVAPFGEAARASLQLSWRAIVVPEPAALTLPEGSASVAGWLNDYTLSLQTALENDTQRGQLATKLTGNLTSIALQQFELTDTQGDWLDRASVDGRVSWQDRLEWDLAISAGEFDLAMLLEDWPSNLEIAVHSSGALVREDDGWQPRDLILAVDRFDGRLRGEPIAVQGRFISTEARKVAGALRISSEQDSIHLRGQYASNAAVDLDLSIDSLGRWLPDTSGRVAGKITLRGDLLAPDVTADLTASNVAREADGLSLTELQIMAEIDQAKRGRLTLSGVDLLAGERLIHAFNLGLEGALASHQLSLLVEDSLGELRMSLAGGLSELEATPRWQGQLSAWELLLNETAGAAAGRWDLDQASDLRLSATEQALAESCLTQGDTRLCLSASQGPQSGIGARVTLERVPLATLQALIGGAGQLNALSVRGKLDAGAEVNWSPGAQRPSFAAEITTDNAAVNLVKRPDLGWLEFSTLKLRATGDGDTASLALASDLQPQGRLRADLDVSELGGELQNSQLEGRLSVALDDLRWLELIVPELVNADGSLRIDGQLMGPANDPDLSAELALGNFSAEIPAVSVTLSEGSLAVSGDLRKGLASVEGQVRSGEGQLNVSGQLGLKPEQGLPLNVTVKGSNVAAVKTRLIELAMSPDITLEGTLTDRLHLGGRLDIDRMALNLEQIESVTQPSADVVFSDQTVEDDSTAMPGPSLTADLQLGLGDGQRVSLQGFGLNANLGGKLQVMLPVNGAPTATGRVDVTGQYRSWGQNLRIDEGRLIYSDVGVDNPTLDIRAYRPLPEVTAGVHLTGTANTPRLNLYSEPTLTDADTLSYIVTGQPVDSVGEGSGDQQQQLASAALAYGINASSLPSRLGLDTVEISDRPDLGGSTLTVGKRLSPKLVLSYATSLFSSENLVQLRYELSRRWRLRVESSTVESRGAIEYYNEG